MGDLAGHVMREVGAGEFTNFRFYLPAITDPVLEIVELGKVDWVSGMALRLLAEGWERFRSNLEHYKKCMVLRPVTICNSPEIIQRLGVIAINGCLEMDLQGQVNSSHVLGAKILTGIAGSYDFSRNGLYSIFVGPSTARGGKISTIVPLVSHVDHTEHDVDILVTEQGLADLRGLDRGNAVRRLFGNVHIRISRRCCRNISPEPPKSQGTFRSALRNPGLSTCASRAPAYRRDRVMRLEANRGITGAEIDLS